MEMINLYSKQRGRVIDFKEILYGYYRYNPLYGADYILDMLLVYKKYRGRKMTVPVRRHAYLQQQFTEPAFREVYEGEEVVFDDHGEIPEEEEDENDQSQSLREVFESSLLKIGENLPSILLPSTEDGNKSEKRLKDKIINFILPLSGRFETFKRFVAVFEKVCLKNSEKVTLTVVLFRNKNEDSFQQTISLVNSLQETYKDALLNVVPVYEEFARAKALEIGASHIAEPNDLLFFIDVDMVFRSPALQRIRANTVRGRYAYFPIVYSEFDPKFVYDLNQSPNHFAINEDTGYWRQYGFGIGSVYKSDLKRVGSFDTRIKGWGREDVDLFDKFINSSSFIQVFRSVDPDLVHVFHVVECDPNLEEIQLKMCLATRADTYGSVHQLSNYIRDHRELSNLLSSAVT